MVHYEWKKSTIVMSWSSYNNWQRWFLGYRVEAKFVCRWKVKSINFSCKTVIVKSLSAAFAPAQHDCSEELFLLETCAAETDAILQLSRSCGRLSESTKMQKQYEGLVWDELLCGTTCLYTWPEFKTAIGTCEERYVVYSLLVERPRKLNVLRHSLGQK